MTQGLVEGDEACEVEWQNRPSMLGGDGPSLGEGVGWGSIKAPPWHTQASASPLPPSPPWSHPTY